MRGLIINRLVFPKNKEQEQEKRKTTIERNWKRRRRRRHFFSKWFFNSVVVAAFFSRCFFISIAVAVFSARDECLFSPSSPFPLLCMKNIAGRIGHKKIRESLAIACKILYLCIQRGPKNIFHGVACNVGRGKQDGASDSIWLKRHCEMTDSAMQKDWNWRLKWLRLAHEMTEIARRFDGVQNEMRKTAVKNSHRRYRICAAWSFTLISFGPMIRVTMPASSVIKVVRNTPI